VRDASDSWLQVLGFLLTLEEKQCRICFSHWNPGALLGGLVLHKEAPGQLLVPLYGAGNGGATRAAIPQSPPWDTAKKRNSSTGL